MGLFLAGQPTHGDRGHPRRDADRDFDRRAEVQLAGPRIPARLGAQEAAIGPEGVAAREARAGAGAVVFDPQGGLAVGGHRLGGFQGEPIVHAALNERMAVLEGAVHGEVFTQRERKRGEAIFPAADSHGGDAGQRVAGRVEANGELVAGDLERAGHVRRVDRLLLLARGGASGRSGGGLQLHRFLPLRRNGLLRDLPEAFFGLREARLNAETALELRLRRLQVAALKLIEARVIVGEG